MRRYKWLAVLLVLLLAGCSLARPEEQGEQADRWIGFYVVPSQGYVDHLAENPYVVEYGTFSAQTDQFGALSFPREVLFAAEDGDGNYTFPGIEKGYSLFIYRTYQDGTDHKGLDYAVGVVSNMAPGEENTQFNYTDEGVSETASGVIYCGPPQGAGADWDPYTDDHTIWRYYNVYQTEDGRVYLDGSGDSVNGLMSKSQTATCTRTWDGESTVETVQVSVDMKHVPRLEKLTVTQFDGENAVLRSEELALRSPLPEVRCEAGAAWVLVEEESGEGTVRTVYNVPGAGEEAVSHQIILLDGEGFGELVYLSIS